MFDVFEACDRDHRHRHCGCLFRVHEFNRQQPAKMAGNFALADRAAQDIKKSTIQTTALIRTKR